MQQQEHPPAPQPAATVLLLRESAAGVEVLLIRRHEQLAFMGGMWVFPGGAVCAADSAEETLARIPERARTLTPAMHTLTGETLAEQERLALAVAAHRETFEETGVLLATHREGRHCDDHLLKRIEAQRSAVASDPALFAELLRQYDLELDLERLVYWAHWITPSATRRRFDTRFFLAAAPQAQTAIIDSIEAVDHVWMTPAALIDAARRRAMPIALPTLYNLMDLDASLARHGGLSQFLTGERNRPVPPVLPKLLPGVEPLVVMPWDAEYASLPGEGTSPDVVFPERLRAFPSRASGK